ncbi:hypothetical protein [Streptomyces longispororuber]|uniref:hypothetical protein n=1 Tax=Streptomyces longispororuber TaxID=68230 RepID=UPI00210BEF0E|nr:hypothetical protein [Streptomyces longispororuber]MCQ4207589.1 hypothetical protein [Streptomyces longispororuber]
MTKQPEEQPQSRVSNELSGQAQVHGPVIQVGTIHGDVHAYAETAPEPEVPLVVTCTRIGKGHIFVYAGTGITWSPGGAVKILVEGLSAQAVVIHAMRPVIVRRSEPRPAALLMLILGILETRGFVTNLDASPPVLQPDGGPDFPFTVSNSDPELFEITPTSTFEVEWRIELDWSSAGRSGTITIAPGDADRMTYRPEPLTAVRDATREEIAMVKEREPAWRTIL